MKQGSRGQDCAGPGVLSNVGVGFRLLASFFFLIWTVQAATAIQRGPAFAMGEDTIVAAEPAAQPTILVRDVARHLGAERSRFKPYAYAHPGGEDGKPFAMVSDSNLRFADGWRAVFYAWADILPVLSPVHTFDARAPPIRRA